MEVKLIVGSTPDAEKKIMAGELDVALVAGQISIPAQFKIVHYLTDEFVLITPPSHALAKLQRLSLKQIAKLPLILREKGPLPRLLIDEAFRAAGIPYNCTMEIASSEGMKRAVAEGLGCSIVSFSSIETELKVKALACVRISGTPIKREFRAILHKDRKILGPVKPFLRLLSINPSLD